MVTSLFLYDKNDSPLNPLAEPQSYISFQLLVYSISMPGISCRRLFLEGCLFIYLNGLNIYSLQGGFGSVNWGVTTTGYQNIQGGRSLNDLSFIILFLDILLLGSFLYSKCFVYKEYLSGIGFAFNLIKQQTRKKGKNNDSKNSKYSLCDRSFRQYLFRKHFQKGVAPNQKACIYCSIAQRRNGYQFPVESLIRLFLFDRRVHMDYDPVKIFDFFILSATH